MICVSIGRGRHKHMIAEHRHLVEQGAQLVELRLDYINGDVNLKRLLNGRPGPVLITCRRQADGGKWLGAEEDRQVLLRTAIAEGVEYVDLEEDVAAAIPRYGKTKRVVSLHDFRKTPEDLPAIYNRLAALDADIVKIATIANNPHDNVRMLRIVKEADVPTIGICMGEIGTPSRILASRFGAPFTYATFHHERSLAPGQLSFKQMREIYHYDQIDRQTEVYGVIADPIGHSLSPQIHNAAFAKLGLNKVYIPFRVPREDLFEFLDDSQELGVKGLSVTIPHKESVLDKLTVVDPDVRGIEAANTVVFEDQQVKGYNTDCQAALDSLLEVMYDNNAEQALDGKTALILGAGGVAKAVAFGLIRQGAEVIVAGRTGSRADRLAEVLGCRSVDWQQRHSVKANILVNCTPVGMHPNVDESPFERRHLKPMQFVFDTVYNPEQTLFIKDARQQGCETVTGVDMFVRQAAIQFKYFTGHDPPTDQMRETLKRATGAVKA